MLNTPNLNSVTNILWVQLSEIQFFYKNLLIMKKLNLEMLRLTSADVLERSQMKKITGGYNDPIIVVNLDVLQMYNVARGSGVIVQEVAGVQEDNN